MASRNPRKQLGNVFSLPEVQERIFGDHSAEVLSWDSYCNIQIAVGSTVQEQGGVGDRFFPLRCCEWQTDVNGDSYPTELSLSAT